MAHLELVEHGVGPVAGAHLGAGQHGAPDAGLHEELLEEGVHVARGATIFDAHKTALHPVSGAGLAFEECAQSWLDKQVGLDTLILKLSSNYVFTCF